MNLDNGIERNYARHRTLCHCECRGIPLRAEQGAQRPGRVERHSPAELGAQRPGRVERHSPAEQGAQRPGRVDISLRASPSET